jgi:uncharacterized phage-associated protein
LYYCQTWYLAFDFGRLFNNKFQAWVHGPVNRQIYDRFKDNKYIYSSVSVNDIKKEFSYDKLTSHEKAHIDSVLSVYALYTGDQLESMAHQEEPWISARGVIPLHETCERELDEKIMETYYKARLNKKKA